MTIQFYLETNKTVYPLSAGTISLWAGEGISSARVIIPDDAGVFYDDFNLRKMPDYRLWARDHSIRRLVLRGIVESVKRSVRPSFAPGLEIRGRSYATYPALRGIEKTYTAVGISGILRDVVSLRLPEIEANNYIYPPTKTTDLQSIQRKCANIFTEMAKRSSDANDRFIWWICNGDHFQENRPNLHFEKRTNVLSPVSINIDEIIDDSVWGEDLDLLQNKAVVYYNKLAPARISPDRDNTASQAEAWGIVPEVFDRLDSNTSAEASDFGDAVVNEFGFERFSGQISIGGDLRLAPETIIPVYDRRKKWDIQIKNVLHRFSPFSFTSVLNFTLNFSLNPPLSFSSNF